MKRASIAPPGRDPAGQRALVGHALLWTALLVAPGCSDDPGLAGDDAPERARMDLAAEPISGETDQAEADASERALSGEDSEVDEGLPDLGRTTPDEPDADGPADLDEEEAGASGDPSSTLEGGVPSGEHCAAVADWDPAWAEFEGEVLALVNEFRAAGADCGTEGTFAAAGPLAMDPILRCSSRLHSLDMYERDFFAHDTPEGISPFDRMAAAGYVGRGGGENIALGQSTPEQVMESWMDSDGHCSNIMNAGFSLIGIGFHPGEGRRGIGSNYWTQNFGTPPRPAGGRGRNR